EAPYLQIVNQILEAQVKARLEKSKAASVQPSGARSVLNFNGNTGIQVSAYPLQVPNFKDSPVTYSQATQFSMCVWVNPTTLKPDGLTGIAGWYASDFPTETLPSLSMGTDQSLQAVLLPASESTPVTQTVSDFFTSATEWVHIAWVVDL